MTAPYDPSEREKVVAKLPSELRRELKVRAAEVDTDIQDAVTAAVEAWRKTKSRPVVDTTGGTSFATYLPPTSDSTAALSVRQGAVISQSVW